MAHGSGRAALERATVRLAGVVALAANRAACRAGTSFVVLVDGEQAWIGRDGEPLDVLAAAAEVGDSLALPSVSTVGVLRDLPLGVTLDAEGRLRRLELRHGPGLLILELERFGVAPPDLSAARRA